MSKLTIVAPLYAKKDQIELLKSELHKLIEITRNEEGCLNYDLHQDNENPTHFLFFENWESRDLWQKHMARMRGTASSFSCSHRGWRERSGGARSGGRSGSRSLTGSAS